MKIKSSVGLLAVLMLLVGVFVAATVMAKPVEPHPGSDWAGMAVWGIKLKWENSPYSGNAWPGVGTLENQEFPGGAAYFQPVFEEAGIDYVRITWNSVTEPSSYTWHVRFRSAGGRPTAGYFKWELENATHAFLPQDFSVVLENATRGILINLRKVDNYFFTKDNGVDLYIDNHVNLTIENLDPLVGNAGDQLRLKVTVYNTGRYSDNFEIWCQVGGSVDPWVDNLELSPGENDYVTIYENLPLGTENIIVWADGWYADDNDYVTATGLAGPNVEISITPGENSGLPGDNVTFIVTVKNVGNVSDNYNLTVSDNAVPSWNPTLDNNLLQNIAPSENQTTTLRVAIPDNATPCTRDNITVTATSQENSMVSDNASCIAHAARLGVEVSISPPENADAPGENVTFIVTVKNLGDVSDNYDLSVSDNATWNPTLDDNLLQNIAPGENQTITLRVAIPQSAENCTRDNITVTATSQENSEVSDNASCVAHALIIYGVEVSISPPENADAPGENVTFIVTVKNLGNVSDNYNLTVSDNAVPSWNPTLDNNLLQNIAPSENKTTTLRVAIPDNALPGSKDTITVTAISQGDNTVSDNASCIASIGGFNVEVSISPSRMDSTPGETLSYVVTVINTGGFSDNYALAVGDTAGWTLALDNNLFENVPPGGSRTTTLRVTIPDNAVHCTEDNITVTATSQENAMVSAENSCIAHVIQIKPVEPHPGGAWEGMAVWGIRLKWENSPYSGNAWPGVGTYYVQEYPGGAAYFQPVFENAGTDYVIIVWNSAAEPSSYTWHVRFRSLERPTAGYLKWELENATHAFVPQDFSVVLENVTRRILVNLRKVDNYFFMKDDMVDLHIDNAVNVRVENTTPTTAAGGKEITFDVIVSNTGRYDDNYSLSASDNKGWGLVFLPSILSVKAGTSEKTTLTATVTSGGVNEIRVTANGAYAFDNTKTTAFGLPIWVSISPSEDHGLPGKTLSYTVTVKNIGGIPDNYILENSDTQGWVLALDNNLFRNVAPDESRTTTLRVTIPDNAVGGTRDNITLTATSQENASISDSVTCTAFVDYLGVEVSIRPSSQGGAPGENLNYEVIVKNTGNINDNYDLEVSDRWSAQISPTSLTVPAGASRTATLSVTIPSGASGGDSMNITVTATSQKDNAVSGSARCMAVAEVPPIVPPGPEEEERPPPSPRLPAEERGPIVLMAGAIFVVLMAVGIAVWMAKR